jgi:serine/threonine-protein kinase HipA
VAGNRDDHLRNHGFLRALDGWRLAPAFDLNPARQAGQHTLSIDGSSDAQGIATALSSRANYRVTEREARRIIGEVVEAVSCWPQEATAAGIPAIEQQIVGAAFAELEVAARLAAI